MLIMHTVFPDIDARLFEGGVYSRAAFINFAGRSTRLDRGIHGGFWT